MRRVLLALAALLLGLAGCAYGQATLSQMAVVKALSFDRGEDARWRVTACVLRDDEGEGAFLRYQAEGDTLSAVRTQLAARSERMPFLGQNELIAVGESLAREDLLGPVQAVFALQDNEGSEQIVIWRGAGSEAFAADGGFWTAPPLQLTALLQNAAANGYLLPLDVRTAHGELTGRTGATLVPVCEKAPGDSGLARIAGMGIVKDGRFAGMLSEEEAWGAKWLLGDICAAQMTVKTGEGSFGVEILRADPGLTVRRQGERWQVEADLRFTFAVTEQPDDDAGLSREGRRELKAAAAALAEGQVKAALFRELHAQADFLDLSATALRESPLYGDLPEDWLQVLREEDVRVRARPVLKFAGIVGRGEYLWEE